MEPHTKVSVSCTPIQSSHMALSLSPARQLLKHRALSLDSRPELHGLSQCREGAGELCSVLQGRQGPDPACRMPILVWGEIKWLSAVKLTKRAVASWIRH